MAYKETSTAPFLIELDICESEQMIIIDGSDFAALFPDQHMRPGRHEEVCLDLAKYRTYLVQEVFRDRRVADEFIEGMTFDLAFTLSELGVTSEKELLDKYFVYLGDDGVWRSDVDPPPEISSARPEFISLLISLDYVVSRGDIVPFILVQRWDDFRKDKR